MTTPAAPCCPSGQVQGAAAPRKDVRVQRHQHPAQLFTHHSQPAGTRMGGGLLWDDSMFSAVDNIFQAISSSRNCQCQAVGSCTCEFISASAAVAAAVKIFNPSNRQVSALSDPWILSMVALLAAVQARRKRVLPDATLDRVREEYLRVGGRQGKYIQCQAAAGLVSGRSSCTASSWAFSLAT